MNIFYNNEENRFRAGWRLVIQLILMFAITFLLFILSNFFGFNNGPNITIFNFFIGSLASVWIAARFIDKRPLVSFGLQLDRHWFVELGIGTVIGGAAMAIIFVIQYGADWIEITGFGWERAWQVPYALPVIGYLFTMLLVGFWEELVFRGYQILNLTEGLSGNKLTSRQGVIGAVVISSAIFGLLHSANPNASVISSGYIMLAGAVIAYPYIVTGSLGLSVGLHFSWNFFQGGVFGFPVSGSPNRSSIIQIDEQGPDLITGGAFGPEAGFSGLVGLLFVFLMTYIWLKYTGYVISIDNRFITSTDAQRIQ